MTNQERLEQIKEAIANNLGLTEEWMDGTYLYNLTRAKSAFSVGTMSLDDFVEIDEELVLEIFNAIKPFFIHQAERVQILEEAASGLALAVECYSGKTVKEAMLEIIELMEGESE